MQLSLVAIAPLFFFRGGGVDIRSFEDVVRLDVLASAYLGDKC